MPEGGAKLSSQEKRGEGLMGYRISRCQGRRGIYAFGVGERVGTFVNVVEDGV